MTIQEAMEILRREPEFPFWAGDGSAVELAPVDGFEDAFEIFMYGKYYTTVNVYEDGDVTPWFE
jgi:hypothetical protein